MTSNEGLLPEVLTLTSGSPPGMLATDTFQLSWTATNVSTGHATTVTPTFTTSDSGVATVNSSGLITAVGAGSATITANYAGMTDSVAVAVTGSVTPDTMTVTPATASLIVGQATALSAILTESGTPLTGRTFTPTTSDAGVATVSAMDTTGDPVQLVTVTGAGAGSATITVTDSGSSLADTCAVTVTAGSAAQAWRSNDFNYADLTALLNDRYNASTAPNGAWGPATEDAATNRMTLGTDGGAPGGSTKYLRYTYPTNRASPLCADFTIGINIQLPQTKTELWTEIWARFSSNYETGTPTTCVGRDNGHKFIFYRVQGIPPGTSGAQRFDILVANHNARVLQCGYPGGNYVNLSQSALPFADYADGDWHQWRAHCKVGASGRYRFWFDGTLVKDFGTVNVQASNLYRIALGRNINLLPALAADMTLDFGLYHLYDEDPGW